MNNSTNRLNWKCAACLSREPKGDNSDTPVRCHDDKVTRHRGAAVRSPVEGRSPLPAAEVEASGDRDMTALAERLDVLVEEIRGFRKELTETRRQVQTFDGKLSGLVTQVEMCTNELRELKSRVEKLENRTEASVQSQSAHIALEGTIEALKSELNERDQELLLNDVEFTCIPEHKGEGLQHIVMTLSSKIGVQLGPEDVVCATRVGRPPEVGLGGAAAKPRPIVVRLVRRALRDDLLRAARVRRAITTDGAREAGRRLGWRFVWTRDGKIFARQHPGLDASRHRIRTQADLERIFGPSDVRI
ncbi:hypothetical protein ACJJTC_012453 [Scirpophaga incertulas]